MQHDLQVRAILCPINSPTGLFHGLVGTVVVSCHVGFVLKSPLSQQDPALCWFDPSSDILGSKNRSTCGHLQGFQKIMSHEFENIIQVNKKGKI